MLSYDIYIQLLKQDANAWTSPIETLCRPKLLRDYEVLIVSER